MALHPTCSLRVNTKLFERTSVALLKQLVAQQAPGTHARHPCCSSRGTPKETCYFVEAQAELHLLVLVQGVGHSSGVSLAGLPAHGFQGHLVVLSMAP